MAESQMTLSMPDQLVAWADAQVADGRFDSVSTYICALIRHDQEREARRRALQAAIDEGRASGISDRDPFQMIAEMRADLKSRRGQPE